MGTLSRKMAIPPGWKLVLYVVGMSWGSLAYGYIASVIGTTIGQPSFLEYMGPEVAEGRLLSLVVSMFYVGGFVGSIITAPLSDRLGRKWTTFIGAMLTFVSNAILSGSVNAAMFIAFRFAVGLSSTILFTVVPVWISEIVPPGSRGMFVDTHPILINLGYCVASYVGVGFYYVNGSNQQWRGPLAIGCLPCILSAVSVFFLPESPRWLLMQGREAQARTIFEKLHSQRNENDGDFATREFAEIKSQIHIDRSLHVGYLDMLKRPGYRKRILIGTSLIFFLEASGALVINNYGTVLYGLLGFNTEQRLHLQAGWVAVGFVTNFAAILIVDRMPRPRLMTLGFLGCLVCVTAEAAIQATYLNSTNLTALRAGVAMLYIFVFFYGLFLDGSTFFYIGEIFPNHIRAQGMTIAMAMLNLMSIVWQTAAQYAFTNVGWKYYLPFIISTAIATVVIPLTFPDTRNKPLEEIAALFGDDDLLSSVVLSAIVQTREPEEGLEAEVREEQEKSDE